MNKVLKTLTSTVVLECYVNRFARRALREIEEAYRRMLEEMLEYALEHNVSQSTLHKIFYRKYRDAYPWLPTRVIKGAYRDAVRRAKGFRRFRKIGKSYKDKPEIRRVTLTYSDTQGWKLGGGVIKVRTHKGWVELHYRGYKQLYRYLYGGWKLAEELKLKINGRNVLAYIVFKRDFEVEYNPRNVVAVDVNENNVTLALFKDGVLGDVYRVETGLGRIVIAYSERRKGIMEGKPPWDKLVRRKLGKLREKRRKLDILGKTAWFIERLALENKAVVVVGDIDAKAKERMLQDKSDRLRHRIHQWSVSTLVGLLECKPVHVVRVSERGTSSRDPFTRERIDGYSPLVIRIAVRGARRVRVVKVTLRVARVNGRVLERDVVGSIGIGFNYLNSNGSPMALGSTGACEVWVKLVIPHQSPTPLTEIQVFTNTIKYR